MADCHNLFQSFNGNISVNKSKKEKLRDAKEKLRARIIKFFKDNHPDYKPKFFIQGSYKTKTMIRTKDDECDLDDGVWFENEVKVTGGTLQKWVRDAVDGHTATPAQHHKKCVRVIYKGDFHIDLPVLKKGDSDINPQLAVKGEDFTDDDPKAFVDWFYGKKTDQLVRICKYLKAWSDHKRNKMPGGLELTILAQRNYVSGNRDDISLHKTLEGIQSSVNFSFTCLMPTCPKEDLFADYDWTRKNNFLDALDGFVESAQQALEAPTQKKACRKWKLHLGNYFPCDEASDEVEEAKAFANPVRINKDARSA